MAAIINTPPPWWANTGYTLLSNEKASLLFRARRDLKRRGLLNERATLPVLVGNAIGAGGSVTASYNRIQYTNNLNIVGNPINSVPTIETVVVHSGVTTAADAATLISMATLNTQPGYVRNGDGNPRGNNGT